MRKCLHFDLQGVKRLARVDRGRRAQRAGNQIYEEQPCAGQPVLLKRWLYVNLVSL